MYMKLVWFWHTFHFPLAIFENVCDFVKITGETVGEVKAVSSMHQRKAEMASHSDAFIALPGFPSIFVSSYCPLVSMRV